MILSIIDFFHKPFSRWINKQTFRYLACGGSNTVFSIFIYWFGYHYIVREQPVNLINKEIAPHVAATFIAFVISTPLGFMLSKYIVFPESNLHGKVQVFRYAMLIGSCLLLNYVFIRLFVERCHFYPTPSSILTAAILAIYSYISQRKFTFKVKHKKAPL
ncbi:MAG: GtrA family protein [Taibaiella sp.]|nr:GtrA family protein [Taibaiella sp.]